MVDAKKKIRKRRRFRLNGESIYQIIITLIVIFMSIICFYPLFYVVGASLMSAAEWQATGGVFFFPRKPTLDAFKAVLSQPALYKSLLVSVARTLVVSLLNTATCGFTGYVLSRKDFFGKKILSVVLFITMIYGGGLIPTYLVV